MTTKASRYQVHILMATYNGGKYLEEQLTSLETQTWKDWYLTVYDDGSTDDTLQILMRFREHLGEDRVYIGVNNPASGSAKHNFMKLIRENKGSYFMCCDQDDVWYPEKIEKSVKRMYRMEKRYGKDVPLLVYSELRVVDEQLKEIAPAFHPFMNLRTHSDLAGELIQNQVTGCTVLFNHTLWSYMQRLTETDKILMHDHALALTALLFGHMSYIHTPLMDYRQHGDNSVGAGNSKSLQYLWHRFKRGRDSFRNDMKASSEQAAYFLSVFGEKLVSCAGPEKMILLIRYASLYRYGKLARVQDFFRFGIWKKGWLLRVVQILWC